MADRLFLAVELDPTLREALAAHLSEAHGELPGRPVPPHNWHLTLRFLGDTPEAQRADLAREIAGRDLPGPFTIGFGPFGAFPRPPRATVLWAGLAEGQKPLGALAAAVEAAAVTAGFVPERRAFSPHLTLSRIRPARDVRPLLAALPPFHGTQQIREMVLYRSRLGSGPARYEAVERWELG